MEAMAILLSAVIAVAPVTGLGAHGAHPHDPTATDGCIFDYPALVITANDTEVCYQNPGVFLTGTGGADTAAYLWPLTYGTEEDGSYPGARVWFHQFEDGSGWADC